MLEWARKCLGATRLASPGRPSDDLRARVDLPLTPRQVDAQSQGFVFTFHLIVNQLSAYETFKVPQLFGLPANLDGLRLSAEASGKHPIFLCDCGDPGCSSVWVDCEVSESVVTWKGLYAYDELSGHAGPKLAECRYRFCRERYRGVVAALEEFVAVYRFGLSRGLHAEMGQTPA